MSESRRKILLRVLLIIVLTGVILSLTYGFIYTSAKKSDNMFHSAIEWKLNDEEKVHLPYYGTRQKNKDYVVLSAELPYVNSDKCNIGFINRNGMYDVIIDGKTVSDGGYKLSESGEKIPVMQWNTIHYDSSMARKEISIRFYLNEGIDFYTLDPIYLGDEEDILERIIKNDGGVIIADVVLIVFSVVIIILAILSRNYIEKTRSYIFFSVFAMLFAAWIMTDRSLSYFFMGGEMLVVVSYVSLSLAPVPFILFMRKDSKGIWKNCYTGLAIGGAVLSAALIAIFALRRMSFVNTITAVHVYILIVLAFSIVQKTSELISTKQLLSFPKGFGLSVFTAFCVSSLVDIRFNASESMTDASTPVVVGFVVYALCIGVDLIYNLRNTLEQIGAQKVMIEEAKTQLVLSQIKPHFIYNSLGAIRVLIKKDPDKAYDALYKFTRYLRQNIDVLENASPIPFNNELEHIQTYVEIERLRFRNKIDLITNTEYVNFSVPPLAIQIFVENAVKHGIFEKEEGGTVTVSSYLKDKYVYIEIEDDGVGFDVGLLKESEDRRSVGMNNAVYRIKRLMDGSCKIDSTPGSGTKVTVKLPLSKALDSAGESQK